MVWSSDLRAVGDQCIASLAGFAPGFGMGFKDTSSLRHDLFVRDGSALRNSSIRVQVGLDAFLDIVEPILPNLWPKTFWRHSSQGSKTSQSHTIGCGQCR